MLGIRRSFIEKPISTSILFCCSVVATGIVLAYMITKIAIEALANFVRSWNKK